jgi:SAM-dependent methyltransferase
VTQLDHRRLSAKEARAARIARDRFLHARAFEDCLDRLNALSGSIGRVVIVGNPMEDESAPLIPNAESVSRLPLESLEPECADLVIAVGVIDHAEDPAIAAFVLRHSLRPGGRLIGATIGNGSLTRLRRAFLDAERAAGRAARRFHNMPDPVSLTAMLGGAGLSDVVIDVDGFNVRYSGLDHLVRDLRSMGCTSSLAGTVPPLQPAVYEKARDLFSSGAERVEERFEILHFSGVVKMTV